MSTAVESANLLLKLYELRREPVMREARNTVFMKLNPQTADDYMAAMMGPDSAHVRMVVSYWEMACSFVVNGAIDKKMFEEANGEHTIIFGKIEGILADLREKIGNPNAFKNLEQVCTAEPGNLEKIRANMQRMRAMMAQRSAAATN
jgi:hypothetical protein